MNRLDELIQTLQLLPHPEGGYYKELYRSPMVIPQSVLGQGFSGDRNVATGIYFLITGGNFSAFHKISADEQWHFYEGDACHVYIIHLSGELELIKLGSNLANGDVYHAVVPAGAWFASMCSNVNGYSLVGCTVAPGFDFEDFVLAKRESLVTEFPQHTEVITKLTRV